MFDSLFAVKLAYTQHNKTVLYSKQNLTALCISVVRFHNVTICFRDVTHLNVLLE